MCTVCLLNQCSDGTHVQLFQGRFLVIKTFKRQLTSIFLIGEFYRHVALLLTEILFQDQNFLNTPRARL